MEENYDRNKKIITEYIIKTLCHLGVLLVITIIALLIINKPATMLVHQAEGYFEKSAVDIKIDNSTYEPMTVKKAEFDKEGIKFASKVANISSNDFGLNSSVYYGVNRTCIRNGVALSSSEAMFGDKAGATVIVGYEQTYLSSLNNAKIGDIITATTNYGTYKYAIKSIDYIGIDEKPYTENDKSKLVITAICSDFSKHKDECLCITAKLVSKEVV